MEFFKPGRVFDFMGQRVFWIPLSLILVVASVILSFYPGPNYGTDFRGGTEVELAFNKPIDASGVRNAVHAVGFQSPDVVQVTDPHNPWHFLIRVQEVTAIDEPEKEAMKKALCLVDDPQAPLSDAEKCPPDARATEVKFSAGGDKVSTRYDTDPNLDKVRQQVESVPGIALRVGPSNPQVLNPRDHRVEVQLLSKGDQLIDRLRQKLGADMVPEHALRVEWVGPKAGEQLRNSARNAVAIAIVFIMLYLAFRFDLRFAPGVIVACIHDAMVVIGVFILLRKDGDAVDDRSGADRGRLFDERHGRRLRPDPREPRQVPRQVVRAHHQPERERDALANDPDLGRHDAQRARVLRVRHERHQGLHARPRRRHHRGDVFEHLRRRAAHRVDRQAHVEAPGREAAPERTRTRDVSAGLGSGVGDRGSYAIDSGWRAGFRAGRAMLKLPGPSTEDAIALARQLGVTRTAASVLLARGLHDPTEGAYFLEPRLAHLTPPETMKDRDEAVGRVARAVRAKERICVFGDYDADGVTAAALLTDVLRALGGEVVTLLADRFDGGYGLSDRALTRVLSTGASLLVTCDCGSSDHERLDRARGAGFDVVVIDHHRVPPAPLPALAFLNPHRPECGFAYKGLASVGLALSVCAGVRAELGATLDLRPWLDLVAIGTIGDVAPLDGDNRPLVRAGLPLLARGTRPGTRALAEVAGCAATTPTGEDVAFRLAPRINAPGRMEKPDLALALLLATTDDEARSLAQQVEAHCVRRKEVERALLTEALAMLEDPALKDLPGIVLAKQGWHPGIVGIIAGRLVSRFRKPAVVIALDGATGRGSARAPAGFSVYEALDRSRDALLGFGGHHAAAGVEVASNRVDALRERFCEACSVLGVPDSSRILDADAELDPADAPARVVHDLGRFEPCGQANPAPRVAIEGARVLGVREVRGGHLRLWLDVAGTPLSCFGGEMGHLSAEMARGQRARVVGALRRDTWSGGGAIEMRLVAAERVGSS